MMLQKYFLATMMLLSLSLISCRQDDEFNSEQNLNSEQKKSTNIFDKGITNKDELQKDENSKRDSILSISEEEPTDPPRNGTHWRQKK